MTKPSIATPPMSHGIPAKSIEPRKMKSLKHPPTESCDFLSLDEYGTPSVVTPIPFEPMKRSLFVPTFAVLSRNSQKMPPQQKNEGKRLSLKHPPPKACDFLSFDEYGTPSVATPASLEPIHRRTVFEPTVSSPPQRIQHTVRSLNAPQKKSATRSSLKHSPIEACDFLTLDEYGTPSAVTPIW